MSIVPSVDEITSSKKSFILSLIFLLLILAAIPLGVYLVQQNANPSSKASVVSNPGAKTAQFLLVSQQNTIQKGAEFTLDLKVKSESEEVNLISAQINFPSENLEVVDLQTIGDINSYNVVPKEWIEKKFDNSLGFISLITGITSNGLKTEKSKEYQIAKIIFKAKQDGDASISIDKNAAILSNISHRNILANSSGFNIKIDSNLGELPTCQVAPNCLEEKPACKIVEPKIGWCPKKPSINLLSPKGGEVYPSDAEVKLEWSSQLVDNVKIGLLKNGLFLGNIATASASAGSFSWRPSRSLSLPLTTPLNTYQIVISDYYGIYLDISPAFETVNSSFKDLPKNTTLALKKEQADLNQDNSFDLTDFSLLLSHMNSGANNYKRLDLNGDNYINSLDLRMLKLIKDEL